MSRKKMVKIYEVRYYNKEMTQEKWENVEMLKQMNEKVCNARKKTDLQ